MVTARYLPHVGGVETHVAETAHRLPQWGFDIDVLAVRSDPDAPGREGAEHLRVLRFPPRVLGPDLYLSPPLVEQLRREHYDLVHVQGVHTLILPEVLLHTRRTGTPSVVTFHTGGHSSWARRSIRGLQWRALGPLLRSTTARIAVSEYERSLIASSVGPGHPIEIIPNGVEPLPVGALDPELGNGRPLIASIGRLEWYKGHHRLINALPSLLRALPEARLVIVGRGPARERLIALARRRGVASHVEWRFYSPDAREGLGGLLANSDLVTLMSAYEAHPIAALEAAALGRRLLVSETTGLAELVRSGLARGVSAKASPGELATAIRAALHEPPPSPLPLPTWEDCTARIATVYRRALSEGAGRSPSRRSASPRPASS